jgi:DNA polymerase-3 subunit epsilon
MPVPAEFAAWEDSPSRKALVVDVETTGLSPKTDSIIELAIVPLEYSPNSGRILEVGEPRVFFEDPGIPIPPNITALTGITDDDVAGKKIDDAAVESLVKESVLVIAHNARFDRGFLDRRLPIFQEKHWACTVNDIPWALEGSKSRCLEYLLFSRCGMFYGAHRAENDCYAVIHLLASPLESKALPLKLLLESARRPRVRIWAIGSDIDSKDLLKARGYQWNNGEDGRSKSWYCEIPEEDQATELEWLRENIYAGRSSQWKIERVNLKRRYSD